MYVIAVLPCVVVTGIVEDVVPLPSGSLEPGAVGRRVTHHADDTESVRIVTCTVGSWYAELGLVDIQLCSTRSCYLMLVNAC